ncbi:MAG: DEAD/DEAH box helicase, partial [Ignisphaera sp.]
MNLDIVFSGDGFAYAREFDEEAVYSLLISPIVNWFKSRYGSLTPPQKMAIPYIKSGYNILVSSPTGTGKTLAVFLPIIDDLYRLALNNELKDQIYVIYVSPLRALNNDMQKNLIQPLAEIRE